MHPAHRPFSRLACLLACLAALLFSPAAPAQERDVPPLRLAGMMPGGARTSATESWGVFDFSLSNFTDVDRSARVLVFYNGQPDAQYGRDLWIPARSVLSSWLLVGPAPAQKPRGARDIQFLLYDRSEGQDRLLLPRTEERVRSRAVPYRKREPFTTVLVDDDVPTLPAPGELPRLETRADESRTLARTFRQTRSLSEVVPTVPHGPLPPLPEAFEGINHFVIASGRIGADPVGQRALRQWLQRGGRVWVLLDMVDPEAVAPLLGDALDFEVVDRISLTRFKIHTHRAGQNVPPLPQEHDQPVDFVRVLLPEHEEVRHTINGWPAWFTRQVGRGRVLFSTLGARGWHRPRTARDRPSPFEHFPFLPVPLEPLNVMSDALHLPSDEEAFDLKTFEGPLGEEIGYRVASRGTAGLIFAAFLLTALALGIVLRRSRRPELLGWLAPAAAVVAAAAFVWLGESSRRLAPATVAVGQVVDAGPDGREAAIRGMVAVYRPSSGEAPVAAEQGGLLELDSTGLIGEVRRLILTDLDAWHMENLKLPAGVRLGSFRWTAPTSEPIAAVARFGPKGIEGKLAAGPFRDLSDALLRPTEGRNLAVKFGSEDTFSAGSPDTLPAGEFLAGTLLSDQQQRRQELYREFLKRPPTGLRANRDLLLAWAKPIDMHFSLAPDARTVGSALLVLPLRLERSPPGQRVTIPGPFTSCRRVLDEGRVRPTLEATRKADMHLRFQLPTAVLPLQVEHARLLARIDAPGRQVTISGRARDKLVKLHHVDSPLDPIRLDITDKRLLQLDEEGGLHLQVALSEVLERGAGGANLRDEKWMIRYLELEVAGRPE